MNDDAVCTAQVWEGDSMDLISRVHRRIMDLQAMHNAPSSTDGLSAPTAVLEHGMNPGGDWHSALLTHYLLPFVPRAVP